MRFFEYESRAIVAKAGIPVTKHGFAKTADEARQPHPDPVNGSLGARPSGECPFTRR